MQIKTIDIDWKKNYPIFAKKEYLETLGCDKYAWIGGFIDTNLCFILPYVIRNERIKGVKFFKILQFQTQVISLESYINEDDEKYFLNEVVKYFRKKKIDFISQPPANAIFNNFPDKAISCHFGSYQLDLKKSEDILWNKIHSKHKNVIRKAIKNKVEIKEGLEFSDIAFEILNKTREKANMNLLNYEDFKKMLNELEDYIRIFVSIYEGIPQGVAIIPFSEDTAYYLWGGSIEKPFLGSLNLLQWEAIKHFKERGIQKYDFVGARLNPEKGSKLEGIQRFKKRFGAFLKEGFLWKIPLRKHKYFLYQILSKIKKSKGDIIDQERRKR